VVAAAPPSSRPAARKCPLHHQLAELDPARELLGLAQRGVRHQAQRLRRGLDARLAITTPLHVRHIENLADMVQQGLFVYTGRTNEADATFVSGECAMFTGSSAPYGDVKRNAKFNGRGIGAPALLPRRRRRAAEHRDRRRQPVGDGRQEARGVPRASPQFFQFLSDPRCRPRATSSTGYLPHHHRPPSRSPRSRGFYEKNPGTDVSVDADDPQDHRQVARRPPGQLRADPATIGARGARAGVGRQEEHARKALAKPSRSAATWSCSSDVRGRPAQRADGRVAADR
jgi:hypothetical protein